LRVEQENPLAPEVEFLGHFDRHPLACLGSVLHDEHLPGVPIGIRGHVCLHLLGAVHVRLLCAGLVLVADERARDKE